MKVLNLRCANGHGFEGWFASEEAFLDQNGRSLIECPLCADKIISRLPSAPRLNLSGAREVVPAKPQAQATVQAVSPDSDLGAGAAQQPERSAHWMAGMRKLLASTEDVGLRFAEEARRIHYGEVPHRGIRGQASPQEREALREEGIDTVAITVPQALDGPLQ